MPRQNAHELIKDFMSDITSSENKRQMNIIIAEAKKVISDYDEQMVHQSDGFNSVQSQSQNEN